MLEAQCTSPATSEGPAPFRSLTVGILGDSYPGPLSDFCKAYTETLIVRQLFS